MQLVQWLVLQPRASRIVQQFQLRFRESLQLHNSFFLSSGRAAMYLLLRTLKKLAEPTRNVVIVPSYTCYSVPASAIRAGLRVRVLDIDPHTLSYDLDELSATDFSNVLAIVSANLYGLPNDLPAIAALARRHGVFFIDDAAQSLGASIQARPVGDHGDAGLFSLDKGKNLTSIQGGILTTRSQAIEQAIRRELDLLPPPPWHRTLIQSIQLVIYGLLLRPWLYWIPARLPFLKLGTTRYEDDYPVERYSVRLGVMAALLFRRFDTITATRSENGKRYLKFLREVPFLHCPQPVPGAQPVYLRFPVIVDTPARRDQLLSILNAAGFGATGSYPLSVIDVPEIQDHLDRPGSHGEAGRSIAARILTLPTHSYVRPHHIDRICQLIRTVAP